MVVGDVESINLALIFSKYVTTESESRQSPKIIYIAYNKEIDQSRRYSSTNCVYVSENESYLLFLNISFGK